MIGCVVLFSRPWLAQNILENFERQIFPDKRLIIVENNRAIGSWRGPGTVVRSEPHRTYARAAGMEACKTFGLGWYGFFEDDDWYGPQYLTDCWSNRHQADALGKTSWIVETPSGEFWLLFPNKVPGLVQRGPVFTDGILAATIFGRVDRAVPWVDAPPVGEEVIWYTRMVEAGRTLWGMGPQHFRLRRYDDPNHQHAIRVPWDVEFGSVEKTRLTEQQARDMLAC
jgi:hypothetical protein